MVVNIFYSDNSNVASCYLWGEGMSRVSKLKSKERNQRAQLKANESTIQQLNDRISQLENELELALLDRCDCDLTEILEA